MFKSSGVADWKPFNFNKFHWYYALVMVYFLFDYLNFLSRLENVLDLK